MTRKILVVEDDKDLAYLLRDNLQDLGYDINLAFDGMTGSELALSGAFHLIVLDINLPKKDGLDICMAVRSRFSHIPILMLTSRSSELDRILGLEIGADDYITKPFSVRELMARVKALFRRMDALKEKPEDAKNLSIQAGDIFIDPVKRAVIQGEKDLSLTAKEFDLLLHFIRHPGRVFTRADLLSQVWGYQFQGYEHTVNSHINRLRSKIEVDPAQPRYVLTVWGVGYKFSEEVDKEDSRGV